jgi:hypothetical protein
MFDTGIKIVRGQVGPVTILLSASATTGTTTSFDVSGYNGVVAEVSGSSTFNIRADILGIGFAWWTLGGTQIRSVKSGVMSFDMTLNGPYLIPTYGMKMMRFNVTANAGVVSLQAYPIYQPLVF